MHIALVKVVRGLGMLELLVCLAIVALMLQLALPSMTSWSTRNQIEKLQAGFVAMLKLGRQSAVNRNVTVSVCASPDASRCEGAWAGGSMAFEDLNADAQLSEGETVLWHIPANRHVGAIHWRSFRNQRVLRLTPRGFTDNQSGSFTFCSPDADPYQARQIVINRTGRVRLARDSNHDGIFEDSAGKPLRC